MAKFPNVRLKERPDLNTVKRKKSAFALLAYLASVDSAKAVGGAEIAVSNINKRAHQVYVWPLLEAKAEPINRSNSNTNKRNSEPIIARNPILISVIRGLKSLNSNTNKRVSEPKIARNPILISGKRGPGGLEIGAFEP